ncbi:uncharacterized protein METZ01_LOCUS230039 [marine metagenome]|uniref:TonB C-terminal domain-containing protein n=1 Tax=marine metagenome TaxID=408172 RepID=A0A382GQU5_9ZZZZ|tara:strand:- start:725 stop:1195 length:471 start_codon:yes stop_codon:yes gene_type:complete
MPSKSISLLVALTLIILLAVVYLGYELTETRKENRALVEQLLQARQQGGSEQGQEAYLKGAVKNTIVKHAGSIQKCFLSMIERSPEVPVSGKVLLDWQIDPSGTVFEAGVVRDEFSNAEFKDCLETNISRIVFPNPPSRNSVYVEHTFLFRKEDNS